MAHLEQLYRVESDTFSLPLNPSKCTVYLHFLLYIMIAPKKFLQKIGLDRWEKGKGKNKKLSGRPSVRPPRSNNVHHKKTTLMTNRSYLSQGENEYIKHPKFVAHIKQLSTVHYRKNISWHTKQKGQKMNPLSISFFVALSSLASGALGGAATSSSEENNDLLRMSPWIKAVRDEAFYRQCQSSCTEFSQGTMTKVELCDDTDVSSFRSDIYSILKCARYFIFAPKGKLETVFLKDDQTWNVQTLRSRVATHRWLDSFEKPRLYLTRGLIKWDDIF